MKYILASLAVCLVLPWFVNAETVIRDGSAITIDKEEVVEGDYYVSVGPLSYTTMSGTVAGDMYGVGGSVNVDGLVGADLTILAGTSYLHASVTDDVRIAAGEVVVANTVGGDLFVLAGTMRILSTAHIMGDIYFHGGQLLIDGKVDGSVHGSMQTLELNAAIDGDVLVTTPAPITVGDSALVSGSVTYDSPYEILRSPGSVVEGRVTNVYEQSTKEQYRSELIMLLVLMFAALSAYLFCRTMLEKIISLTMSSFMKSLVIGLAVFIVVPVVSIGLLISVIGSLPGVFFLSAFATILIAAKIVSAILLGAIVTKFFSSDSSLTLVAVVIGVCLLSGASIVPVVGGIFSLTLFMAAVGGIVTALYQFNK